MMGVKGSEWNSVYGWQGMTGKSGNASADLALPCPCSSLLLLMHARACPRSHMVDRPKPKESLGKSEMMLLGCNNDAFPLPITCSCLVVVGSVDPAGQLSSLMSALVRVRFSPRSPPFLLFLA